MPFDKFAKSHPKDFAANAHLFKQDGDSGNGGYGGGWGMRPGQYERTNFSEKEENESAIFRLSIVVALNVILTSLAIICIVLIGPLAVVLFVTFIIVIVGRAVYPFGKNESVIDAVAEIRLRGAQVAVVSGTLLLCGFWWLMVAQYWWEHIVDWYPVKLQLHWFAVVIFESLLGSFAYGLNDGRVVFRRILYDPHWSPTRQPMPWYIDPLHMTEYTDDDSYSDDEIRAMLEGALSANNTPRVIPAPVPVYSKDAPNPNGNGHKPPPFTSQTTIKREPEMFKAPGGHNLKWPDFVEFVWCGIDYGISTPTWVRRRNWTKEYIADLQDSARVFGLANYSGKGSANKLTITSKQQATTELQRIHSALYPPAPLSQPSGAENEPTPEGRKVSEGRKEG